MSDPAITHLFPKNNSTRIHGYISKMKRLMVYETDMYECVYCGCVEELSLDHVVAASCKSLPPHILNLRANLLTSCRDCNEQRSRTYRGARRRRSYDRLLIFGRFRGVTVVTMLKWQEEVSGILLRAYNQEGMGGV